MPDLSPFDPTAEFVAALPIRYAGKAHYAGQPIDKSLAGASDAQRERTLRLMYENRRIRVAAPVTAASSPVPLNPQQLDRIAELEKQHSREELDKMASAAPYNIADADKLPNKTAVATAIVRAEAADASA